jgi:two-component system, chemotaxis family, chemotaxis protein CheY
VSRVLAVDDSPTLLGMLVRCLRDGGHEVFTASNGQEALEALRLHAPDMVVTDLNMPVMSGLEFIEAARAEPAGQGVPIVLLTTETAPELAVRAKAVKATGWLAKPLDGPRLLALVADMA